MEENNEKKNLIGHRKPYMLKLAVRVNNILEEVRISKTYLVRHFIIGQL